MFVSSDKLNLSDQDDDIFTTRRQKKKIQECNDKLNMFEGLSQDSNVQENQDAIKDLFSQMEDGFFFGDDESNKENNNPQTIAAINKQMINNYKANHNNKSQNKRSFSDLSSDDDTYDNNQPSSKRRKIDKIINKDAFNFLTTDLLITKYTKQEMMDEINECVNGFENCYMTNKKIYGEIESIDTLQIYQVYIILLNHNDNEIKGFCTCSTSNYSWCKHMIALGITFIEAKEIFIYKQDKIKDNNDDEKVKKNKNENQNESKDKLRYITMSSISDLCTDISWSRAQEYIDCFIECNKTDDSIFGSIEGRSHPINYNVSISVRDLGELDGECSCPSHHYWCKHIGALGITFVQHKDKFEYVPQLPDNDDINHNPKSGIEREINSDLEDNEENWLLNLV